jgi:DNA-binding NtrC family response regulator
MLLRTLVVAKPGPQRSRTLGALDEVDSLVTTVDSSAELRAQMARKPFDLAVVSRAALPDFSLDLLAEVQSVPESPAVVVLAEREDPEERGRLLAAGCLAVVYEGLGSDTFREVVKALAERRLAVASEQMRAVPDEDYRLGDYATSSPAMREFLRIARRVASKDCTLLLTGETGVGKGLLARSIHNEGPRAGRPFVAVNCGALNETLLESQLFGHEKGAFTGAARARRGFFELAHKGTIFLDEVGELPLHLQVKLLRALEDGTVQPLGSETPIKVDTRIIAATNKDLPAEVENKRFRSDLFYRLNVVSLTLPPLRERTQDIAELARSYVDHFRERTGGEARDISPAALEALLRHPWPGNLRELINVIERGVIMTSAEEIRVEDLPLEIQEMAPPVRKDLVRETLDEPDPTWLDRAWSEVRRQVLEETELRYLRGMLQATRGRVGEAAKRAGMDPRSMHQKMRKYGLRKEDFR